LRAYRHTSFTGFDALDLVDEEIPQPEAGQVLVRVRASSLNFRDPVIASGEFPFPASPGFIALSERMSRGSWKFEVTAVPPARPLWVGA
jgi:NADPH:quinone reductase-like Zn-dependent oxidoreductase